VRRGSARATLDCCSEELTTAVWVCGCVGVGVWVCLCVGVFVCGCVCVWVCLCGCEQERL